MDLQDLTNLFSRSFNPNPNVRKAAELQIRKVGVQDGVIAALLQIVSADQQTIDPATRQACVVWLKNRVQYGYALESSSTERPDRTIIVQSDKDALKSHILPLLAASPSRSITVQLATILRHIVAHDFPARWPTLLDELKALLGSGNIREVHAGCVATLEAVRSFRYRQRKDVLPGIVSSIFPTLVNIATQMMTNPFNPSQREEIPTLLHLILKTYKTSTMVNLSSHQQNPESLVPWGQLLFAVINLDLPSEVVPEDEEEREKCEWWRAKKWAYGTLGRLFHRFGNPSQMPRAMKEDYGSFAQHFETAFAPEILRTYLGHIELYVQGQRWISKKCQFLILNFFVECVKPKSTWTLLKPHFLTLVSSLVFPHLSFTREKQDLWEDDPVDYVRVSLDDYETYTSPVSASTSLLLALATKRTKVAFVPILAFINSVLSNAETTPHQRFGALNMTAALGPLMMDHPDVKKDMENFMTRYVLKEYQAPEPYLRAVSCEILGVLAKSGLQWANEENLNSHFHGMAPLLNDREVPVRVQACLTLSELVQAYSSVRTQVAPQIGKVIQDLLQLSEDTDLDVLNQCMDVVVENFQEELLPVATQLTARLVALYIRLARECSAQDAVVDHDLDLETMIMEADDDKSFAAMGVAKTIATVVSSIENAAEILPKVQNIIIPAISFTLEHRILDLYDNMYDLLDALTFKSRIISPEMWVVFEQTCKSFQAEGIDYLDEMLPGLDNFLSFGADVFKTRADYRQMIVDIYVNSMESDHLGEADRCNGSKLVESLLLNLRGCVDDHLQTIIHTAMNALDKENTAPFRLANLEVLINAILYNSAASLHIMETLQPGAGRSCIERWFKAITAVPDQLPRVHDKKLTILSLCALLEMPASSVPDTLKPGWPGIVTGVLTVFRDLPKAIANREALKESLNDDDESIADKALLNLEDDDEGQYPQSARQRERLEKREAGEDPDEESDEEDDPIEEDLGFIDPLDSVDPYAIFRQALTAMQMNNAEAYQTATTSLSVDQQTLLMEIMRIADTPLEARTAPSAST
ncbi:ARM repeat-containing protein [Fistulina hepatica ATCC 64428]|uniref:ARM repeat-containing protein n=1 Tax=Fistulina hepatica ATCC 64428 TaxID=1128425 RepID=A0A0D7AJN6_9AGAR|nr:ARM repeat-containing protein [Fistulina hepatica ATCC 64428]